MHACKAVSLFAYHTECISARLSNCAACMYVYMLHIYQLCLSVCRNTLLYFCQSACLPVYLRSWHHWHLPLVHEISCPLSGGLRSTCLVTFGVTMATRCFYVCLMLGMMTSSVTSQRRRGRLYDPIQTMSMFSQGGGSRNAFRGIRSMLGSK